MNREVERILALPGTGVVRASTQAELDVRAPALLRGDHDMRVLVLEPLLGEVDLAGCLLKPAWGAANERGLHPLVTVPSGRIGWVILSGGSEPLPSAVARSVRDQCAEADVPFWFEGWGDWFPRDQWEGNPELALPDDDCFESYWAFMSKGNTHLFDSGGGMAYRVGAASSGRALDGCEHDGLPAKGNA